MLRSALFAVALGLLACGGPFVVFPGGALSGDAAESPPDWSFLPDAGVLAIETRPADPYSVNVNYVQRQGRLYVDPSPERRWGQNLQADPDVRIRIDGSVYEVRAVLVTDPAERQGFPPDRLVMRLEPD